MLAESFESRACQVNAGEPDGGERRKREFGEINVVEADDGQILGHAQVLHVGGAQNADGGHVIGTDDCGGPRASRLEFAEPRYAALEGVVAFDDPFFLDGQFAFLHCGPKVVLAGDGGVQLVRAGKEADLAMAEGGEVIDGGANAGGVVEEDGAGLGIVELELGKHDGHVVK